MTAGSGPPFATAVQQALLHADAPSQFREMARVVFGRFGIIAAVNL